MTHFGFRAGLIFIALGFLAVLIARMRPPDQAGAARIDYGRVPEFSLTESSGRIISLQDLRGKPWVVDFIFTSCAGTCPAMSLQMRKLQKELPHDVRLVSVTV